MVKKATPKSKTIITSKKLLAQRIANRVKLTQVNAERVIAELLSEIKKSLVKGEEVRLQGYFTLKTTLQKPRIAMNLQTGKKMKVPEKRIPKVKFSVDLKEEIAKRK